MKKLRFSLFLFVFCGIVILLLILFKYTPNPPFSRTIAPLLQALGKPIQSIDRSISRVLPINDMDEKKLGEEIKALLPKNFILNKESATTIKYLNSLVKSLCKTTRKPFEYKVFIIDGSPNACALPGGIICVTDRLLNILENEAELVAVLGHEIGHIEHGHLFDAARGKMFRKKIAAIGIAKILGLVRGITKFSFSKTQEDEADEYGFRMLLQNGYDPNAMSSSLKKLLSQSKNLQKPDLLLDFMNSHPYIELRIEKFLTLALHWKKKHPQEKYYLGKKNLDQKITFFENSFTEECGISQ